MLMIGGCVGAVGNRSESVNAAEGGGCSPKWVTSDVPGYGQGESSVEAKKLAWDACTAALNAWA